MSNRTLVEFNHDFTPEILEHAPDLMVDLGRYLGSLGADKFNAKWSRYGVRIKHTRHHSEPCPTDIAKQRENA